MTGLGPRVLLTAGSALGVGAHSLPFLVGDGGLFRMVSGVEGVVGWRDCWIVGRVFPVLKFPTQRDISYCFRLFFLFVYMQ